MRINVLLFKTIVNIVKDINQRPIKKRFDYGIAE